jgi:hypothetical protein
MQTDCETLYRPVGEAELKLIEASSFRSFPPRLPEQPIFYPVTTEAYAAQIARDWNTKFDARRGFVTRFKVKKAFLAQFERQIAGSREHEEYWIPAERLEEFNSQIEGPIEVISEFNGAQEC